MLLLTWVCVCAALRKLGRGDHERECEQGSHIRSSHTNMLSEFAAAKNLSIYVPVKIDFLVKYYLGLGSRPREDR